MVVYRVFIDVNESALYSVSISDGFITKLSGSHTNDKFPLLSGFQISPDSRRVVYLSSPDFYTPAALYSVPIEGGTPEILYDVAKDGGRIQSDFRISADSNYFILRGDRETEGVIELFSTPMDRGRPVKLNNTLVTEGYINSFKISPDSNYIVYSADPDIDGVTEIYSVPISGGTAKRLNSTLVAGGDVSFFKISDDGNLVVYLADQDTDGINELYASSLTDDDLDFNNNGIGGVGCFINSLKIN